MQFSLEYLKKKEYNEVIYIGGIHTEVKRGKRVAILRNFTSAHAPDL